MSEAISAPKKRRWFAYSLGTLFCVVTAICVYQAYRTNQQILKYYTPAPAVSYDPEFTTYEFTDADFVYPLDPRPASLQLTERVGAITDRIAVLRSRGESRSADEMQAALDQLRANCDGPYAIDGTLQLHAIGIYDSGDFHVRITYTGAPIIVAFCAYEHVRWIVDVEPGVQLKKVILAGHRQQLIKGVPKDVPVEGQIADGRDLDPKYRFYADTALEAGPAADRLKELTNLDATTFFTTHEYEGMPYVIGPGGNEWSAMMNLRALATLHVASIRENRAKLAHDLVRHSFPDIHCAGPGRFGRYVTSFGTHSIFGPYSNTLQPMPQPTTQFAVDPRGPSFFGWNRGIVTIDPQTGLIAPWPMDGLEQQHGDVPLAFDTKRNRLLLWTRDLLAVDILKKEATEVCKGNPEVHAMTYCDEDDRIYACCASYDGNSHGTVSEIRTYNHRGAELSRVKLAVPIPAGHRHLAAAMKVRIVAGKLLIMSLGNYDGNSYLIPSDTNYVVDPKTGELLFACRRAPR
jgi:hypothetical protein